MLLRYLGLAFAGLKTFVVRYAITLVVCGALWWLLHVLRPCDEPSYLGPPECSVLQRTIALQFLYWDDWIIFALLSLELTLLWTILFWALRIWRFLEIATKERAIQPLLGSAAICTLVFAMCVIVEQLASGLRPCFTDLIARPLGLFGCYIFFSDEHPVWPSNDLRTYAGLAILALVIVGTRFAFSRGCRS